MVNVVLFWQDTVAMTIMTVFLMKSFFHNKSVVVSHPNIPTKGSMTMNKPFTVNFYGYVAAEDAPWIISNKPEAPAMEITMEAVDEFAAMAVAMDYLETISADYRREKFNFQDGFIPVLHCQAGSS